MPSKEQKKPLSRVKLALLIVIVWLIYAAVLFIYEWPNFPKTVSGWILYTLIVPPLYCAGELVFDWLFSKVDGYKISPKPFSILRITILVTFSGLILAACLCIGWLIER